MNLHQCLRKAAFFMIVAILSIGFVFPFSSQAAENQTYKVPSRFKGIQNIPAKALDTSLIEFQNKKSYLTDEDINRTNSNDLQIIGQEIIQKKQSGKYTDDELNQLAADKIKKSTQTSTNLNSYSTTDSDYPPIPVPGFGKLTGNELKLATSNPAEFAIYAADAVEAYNKAKQLYSEAQLSKGNGDAFRHAFWNAILVKDFGGNNRDHGDQRAETWTDAHEQYSTGVDHEMDLYNNYVGREYAYFHFSFNHTQLNTSIQGQVAQGATARIVNGNLVATNGDTGKN
ncbi:hypothetical protein NIE88_09600 [Sporolactobacillus shoreicorticis]|uniref:DUF6973 domain-containing protein n=1 Tax=Sporolactobacillus shoreicorticis TaxID=1923877 RepID=A0ABW5S9L9_9BACL|nr:hypothetical protein [Sporolactobacillus shoreicorticis]MCO7126029.1 hypothetical protein [Sporolactobacillus shoreicorticis]